MNNSEIAENLLWENRFWRQIMGDNAKFIYFSPAPSEGDKIEKAKQSNTIPGEKSKSYN